MIWPRRDFLVRSGAVIASQYAFLGLKTPIAGPIDNRSRGIEAPAPVWLRNAPLLTWQEIPDTSIQMDAADGKLDLPAREAKELNSYSGAVLMDRATMVIHGGGHGPTSGGGVYGIDLLTNEPRWRVIGAAHSTKDASTTDDGYFHPYDGTPVDSHTYWNIHFDPVSRRMYRVYCTGDRKFHGRGPYVDSIDLDTGKWSGKGAHPDYPIVVPAKDLNAKEGTTEWMTPDRRIWSFGTMDNSGRLKMFDIEANEWTVFPGSIPGGYIRVPAIYDPVRKRVWFPRQQYENSPHSYDMGKSYDRRSKPVSSVHSLKDPEGLLGTSIPYPISIVSGEYCSDRDSYLLFRWAIRSASVGAFNQGIFEINPDTHVISTLHVAGEHPVPLGADWGGYGQFYRRFMYIEALGAVVLQPRASRNLCFFRTR